MTGNLFVIHPRSGIIHTRNERKEEDFMSTLEANLELLSTIPEERQEEIHRYLLVNFCRSNPYKPLDQKKILSELAESRACYDSKEREDFDRALDEIRAKYDL